MDKINYDNLYKLFDNYNEHTDCYPGAMFISIYHEIPICYTFYFDDINIKLSKYIDKLPVNKIKNTINDKILLDNITSNDNFEVIQYSVFEYLILGKCFQFLMIITISGESEKSSSVYQNIFISNKYTYDDINNIYNTIHSYFTPVKKEENIDFGITAVDISGSLYTNYYDFKEVDIDIEKNYNDDLPYDRIIDILNKEESSELILLYGEPGTGKSSLIKKFISDIPDKDFIFIDSTLLSNMQQDRLMSYFLECKDSIFIFEDCEKILLNRDNNNNPTMSILLNLTDGIISDILNIKIICTFNTSLNNIDKALIRKGRLSLKYEFKKLTKDKVRKILEGENINQDMSLADIYYYKEENDFSKKQQNKIGF